MSIQTQEPETQEAPPVTPVVKVNVTGRTRAPRGFWFTDEVLGVIAAISTASITVEQGVEMLGANRVNPIDLKWRAKMYAEKGTYKR